jgi:hypothetical protein
MNIHTMFDFNLPSGFIISLRSKVKVPRRSLRYATHRLMVMHPHTKYHWPISKDKNVMVQTRKYYLKNNYLTFRSNVKVPSRSLWYKTHRLMVMHPHTKYHWPISKETIIWPWGQRSRSNKGHYGMWQTALWSCTHIPNIFDLSRKTNNGMPRTRKYYLKNNYLTFRSKVMVPRRLLRYTTNRLMVMQHTTLWTCTHIPNIIDLSRKTKRLWSGQASLRSRSGRRKSD